MKFVLFFLFLTNLTFSQSIEWIQDVTPVLKTVSQINYLENDESKERIFCFTNKDYAFSYLMNQNFQIKDSFNLYIQSKKLGQFIGGVTNKNSYSFIYLDRKQIKSVYSDFVNKNFTIKERDFQIDKNHEILQHFKHKNQLYVVSLSKKNNILHFYKISDLNKIDKKIVDLNTTNFRNWDGKVSSLYSMILSPSQVTKNENLSSSIQRVKNDLYNDLRTVNSVSKYYLKNGNLVLTLDANSNFTQIVTINLKTWTHKVSAFPKPKVVGSPDLKKSNSFLFNNLLFSIVITDEELNMHVLDYLTKDIKKEYSFKKTDDFTIKNTGYIIENGPYSNYREISGFNNFLRKITSFYFGLTVDNNQDNYEIIFGSASPLFERINYMPIGIPIGQAVIGAGINMTASFSSSGGGGREAHTTTILNSELEHVKGKFQSSLTKEINDFNFSENLKPLIEDQTIQDKYPSVMFDLMISELDGKLLKGFYFNKAKKFILVQFNK